MSSHREAPEISKDPVADSTDLYAFVSPDAPDTVTIIANYVPLQGPAGGPNFYEFGDDVLYEIHVDNDGDAVVNVTYEFRFTTQIEIGGTFLYNVGPIDSLNASTWNRRQFYTLTKIDWGTHHGPGIGGNRRTTLATNVPCPPCNIGPRSTPNYAALAAQAITSLPGGGKVFAGQRAEGFYVDLGSIFDLGALRPIQSAHVIPIPGSAAAVNATKDLNVHSIALQLPKTALTNGMNPTNVTKPTSVLGIWTTASRQRVHFNEPKHQQNPSNVGPWTQVSRLGNPLFNEVLVPMERKDDWNGDAPTNDEEYADGVLHPELAKLLPILYPGAFPNLAALVASGKPRADLAAVLLTGIPNGIIGGFQNFTGATQADLLRLNVAIPPAAKPNNLGVVGGDLAGFPNGRRVADDVVNIELKAIAGATYPLIDGTYTPDAAVAVVDQGVSPVTYLANFPYLGTPHSGYETPRGMTAHLHENKAHEHPHVHHPVLPPSGDGTVMLDIGEGVGALVVHAPASLAGVEIELARAGATEAFTHTEVRERVLPDGTVYAGVYPAIAAGDYTVLDVDGAPRCAVTVNAGAVTEAVW